MVSAYRETIEKSSAYSTFRLIEVESSPWSVFFLK